MNEVKNPNHYTWCEIEPKDVIYDWKLPWHLGNTIKYINRAGRKNPKEYILDLKKAQECLCDYIKRKEYEELLREAKEEKDFHEGHEPQGNYDHFEPAKYEQVKVEKKDLVRGV